MYEKHTRLISDGPSRGNIEPVFAADRVVLVDPSLLERHEKKAFRLPSYCPEREKGINVPRALCGKCRLHGRACSV